MDYLAMLRSTLILGWFLAISHVAFAFECAGVKLPSNIVICSDPELVRLADERQQIFNELRWGKTGIDLLDSDRDKELWENQKTWVREYATRCGAPPDQPLRYPIRPLIRE